MAKQSKRVARVEAERLFTATACAALVPFVTEATLVGRVCGDIVGDFQLRSRKGQAQRALAYILDAVKWWPAVQAAVIKADLAVA